MSSLGTIRTTPYCYHKLLAGALGFCGIENAPERPQQNSHWRAKYQVREISYAHRLARSNASDGAVRDAKKATKYLSNNSLLPDKSIKKAQATALTYPVLRPWLPTKRISNTDSPRRRIYRTHRANVGGKDIHLAWTSDCESSFCLNRQVRVRKITTINVN